MSAQAAGLHILQILLAACDILEVFMYTDNSDSQAAPVPVLWCAPGSEDGDEAMDRYSGHDASPRSEEEAGDEDHDLIEPSSAEADARFAAQSSVLHHSLPAHLALRPTDLASLREDLFMGNAAPGPAPFQAARKKRRSGVNTAPVDLSVGIEMDRGPGQGAQAHGSGIGPASMPVCAPRTWRTEPPAILPPTTGVLCMIPPFALILDIPAFG